MRGTRAGALRRRRIAFLWTAAVAVAGQPLFAGINLVWRTDTPTVCVGEEVRVRLYAVSDNPEENEYFIAADVGFAWDQPTPPNYPVLPVSPAHLQFLGLDNTGSVYAPPNPEGISELLYPDTACTANEAMPPADGDGFYRSAAPLGRTITATPEGSLLTTFVFRAIAPTPAAKVEVLFRSRFCFTKVFDEETPNLNIINPLTGYGSIHITVNACEGCDCPGDMDANAVRNGADIQAFVNCVLGASSGCECADADESGAVDVADVNRFVTDLRNGSACP